MPSQAINRRRLVKRRAVRRLGACGGGLEGSRLIEHDRLCRCNPDGSTSPPPLRQRDTANGRGRFSDTYLPFSDENPRRQGCWTRYGQTRLGAGAEVVLVLTRGLPQKGCRTGAEPSLVPRL